MRRIVVTHRHLRGRQTAELPSPSMVRLRVSILGLYQPHTGKVTVPGTGTRQPSSCGKGPKAVGESVMTLPGKPQGDATWLECKGLDLSLWWQSRCSSLSVGRPRTWRRAAGQGTVGIRQTGDSRSLPLMAKRVCRATHDRSVCKDRL